MAEFKLGTTIGGNVAWHEGNDGTGSGLDADLLDGLQLAGAVNNQANQVVRTDASGYIQAGYIHSASGNEGNNSSPARVWGTNGSDSYLRTYLTSALSVSYATSAGNAGTLDSIDSSQFLRSDVGTTWSGNSVFRVTTPAGASGATTGQVYTLEVFQANVNADAFMTFHVGGDYAAHFGLDGNTNDLFYGGWSVGGVKHRVYHAGNTSSNSIQIGSLGVGTAASGTTGEIRATNEITAFFSSDISLKENVRSIDGALDKVCAIGGKYFDWKDDYIKKRGGEDGYFVQKSDFGVIAQDVEKSFPVAVRKREDGTLVVDYEKLCALAFEAIKELKEEIEQLKRDR